LANLVEKETSQRIFNRYLLKDYNGFKIGVLGLLSKNGFIYARPEDKEKYRLLPPIETARSIVSELKKMKCQTIVAVTYMSPEENRSLAEACPQIQWIIQGDSKEAKAEAKVIHKTQIVNAGDRGEFLGGSI
jgi:5'-nucleotidase/UDP-sugar diphosphatase